MKRTIILGSILAALIGGIAATYAALADAPPDNLICAEERVVVYGWTSKRVSMAELAAIAKWQQTVKSESPGFEQWHQAYKRNLSCRLFEESSHYQCQISATPCRFSNS